jgi:hypothetical protein
MGEARHRETPAKSAVNRRESGGHFLATTFGDGPGKGIVVDVELRVGPYDRVERLVELLALMSVPHNQLLPRAHRTTGGTRPTIKASFGVTGW